MSVDFLDFADDFEVRLVEELVLDLVIGFGASGVWIWYSSSFFEIEMIEERMRLFVSFLGKLFENDATLRDATEASVCCSV